MEMLLKIDKHLNLLEIVMVSNECSAISHYDSELAAAETFLLYLKDDKSIIES